MPLLPYRLLSSKRCTRTCKDLNFLSHYFILIVQKNTKKTHKKWFLFQLQTKKMHKILCKGCREMFCGLDLVKTHLKNCFSEIVETLEGAEGYVITKDQKLKIYCFSCKTLSDLKTLKRKREDSCDES